MTPDQVKAARRLLGWGIQKLSARSNATYHLIDTYERSGRVAVTYGRMCLGDPLLAIRVALEEAGVEFTNGVVPGVQLRRSAE